MEKMIDKLWRAVGVTRTHGSNGEYEYELAADLNVVQELMLEVAYVALLCAVVAAIGLAGESVVGAICGDATLVSGLMLLPIVMSIIEGRGSTWRKLW